MIPDSLLNFLETKGKWPDWLPVIVRDLKQENLREWDEESDIPVIMSGSLSDLDPEATSLVSDAHEKGTSVVKLWNRLTNADQNEAVSASFSYIESEDQDRKIREIILNHFFESPKISDEFLRTHVDRFPQYDRYPVLAETKLGGEMKLVIVPEPGNHWRFSRINVMPEGGKIWFPIHNQMRKSKGKSGLPPWIADYWNENYSTKYSYVPNNDDYPLCKVRGLEKQNEHHEQESSFTRVGPNVIFWEHDENSKLLKRTLSRSIEHLRERPHTDRPPIRLSGPPDLEIGTLRVLAPRPELTEMLDHESSFRTTSLLNLSLMPEDCIIKQGFETSSGEKFPFQPFSHNKRYDRKYYSFHPSTNNSDLDKILEIWNRHLFNWTHHIAPEEENIASPEERGTQMLKEEKAKYDGDIWKAILEDEGSDENSRFNYGIICRDIRLDYVMLEISLSDKQYLADTLEISRIIESYEGDENCNPGGLWVFEGYWSKPPDSTAKRDRQHRFEIIHQKERNVIDHRYVDGKPRISTTHPDFSSWQLDNTLGFGERANYSSLNHGKRPSGLIDLIGQEEGVWFPCTERQNANGCNIGGVEQIFVDKETADWALGVGKKTWKPCTEKLLDLLADLDVLGRKEVLGMIDRVAENSPDLHPLIRKGLRKCGEDELEGFQHLSTIISKKNRDLGDALQEFFIEYARNEEVTLKKAQDLFNNTPLCNWEYESDEESKFIPIEKRGITGRDILVVSEEDAKLLFGFDNRFGVRKASQSEWSTDRFSIQKGRELVIFPKEVVETIEEADNIARLRPPKIEILIGKKIQTPIDDSLSRFGFLNSLLTIHSFKTFSSRPQADHHDLEQMLENREEFELRESDGGAVNKEIRIGRGGWFTVEDDGKTILQYGSNPGAESMKLLGELLKNAGLEEEIVKQSTHHIGNKQNKRLLENLIAGVFIPTDHRVASSMAAVASGHLEPFWNPISPIDEHSWRSLFTLQEPSYELEQQSHQWKTSKNAENKFQHLKKNYKMNIEDGSIGSTSRNRSLLEAMYQGRHCIGEGFQPVITDSDPTSPTPFPRHRIDIANSMLKHDDIGMASEGIKLQDVLGNTLIVGDSARYIFLRTDDDDRLDFSSDFLSKMEGTVSSDHWNDSGDFILTDGLLTSPNGLDSMGVHLHKLHHLHIMALFSAITELEG